VVVPTCLATAAAAARLGVNTAAAAGLGVNAAPDVGALVRATSVPAVNAVEARTARHSHELFGPGPEWP